MKLLNWVPALLSPKKQSKVDINQNQTNSSHKYISVDFTSNDLGKLQINDQPYSLTTNLTQYTRRWSQIQHSMQIRKESHEDVNYLRHIRIFSLCNRHW